MASLAFEADGVRDVTTAIHLNRPMKILYIILFLCTEALAMDRWTALAMVESGGDDYRVGRAGEVSRYQIRPELWPGGNPLDTRVALANARHIMASRMARFEQLHGRAPNNFEFYVLWNAPAQINHPHPVVTERARRFANLVVFAGPTINPLITDSRSR